MLSLSPATRIFLALAPIDGRKSFNGLCTLVKETLEQEPTSGFLFVFINKARNRLFADELGFPPRVSPTWKSGLI